MYAIYHIAARIYVLLSAIVAPAICLGAWLLIVQASRKRLRSYVRWLRPAAIGATLACAGVLVIAFVIFMDPRNYGLAVISYLLSAAGILSGGISCWRLWCVMKVLSSISDEPDAERQQEDVWPPPPRR